MPREEYRSVTIQVDLYDDVEEHIQKHKDYPSISKFTEAAITEKLSK